MKQKLALCCALVHRPELLVLDEPTTGVDAVSRRDFWDLLATLRDDGLPILVSTPYMDEASRCDRVALMQTGQLLAVDSPDAIRQDYPWPLVAVRTNRRYEILKRLRDLDHAHSVFPFGATLHYADERTDTSPDVVAEEVGTFLERHDLDADVYPIRPDIEDVFMARASTP
jgi:ABC-type multidrug transport system ATPase subunit